MIQEEKNKQEEKSNNDQQQQSLNLINKTRSQTKFYRPSDINQGCCCYTFDLRFQQMTNSYINKGFFAKAQALYKRLQYENKSNPKNLAELQQKLPINFNPDFTCSQDKIKFTWIGHATAIIQIGNHTNILIDPMFSQRCSPFQWIGPKRYRSVPCSIKQLPKIDIVLISHDHYDHCDRDSIEELQKIFKPHFFAGLQSHDLFPQNSNYTLLDWTQTKSIQINNNFQLKITFIPTCHWSRRGLFDYCKRLWGGFIITTPQNSHIFYSGDTGYCPIFEQISNLYNQFQLCIFPIGSYQPRELLKNQHISPEDAIKCHLQLKSKKSVGIHWGTFSLGREHWLAAKEQLEIMKNKYKIKKDQFVTVKHGGGFEIDYKRKGK